MTDQQQMHVYDRDTGGALSHSVVTAEDFGGRKGAAGEVVPLVGWPTPAMRRGTDSAGTVVAWYVGVDESGKIAEVAS